MTTTRMHNVHFSFFIFSSLISALSVSVRMKKARMHNVHQSFFIFSSLLSALKDEQARMHTVHFSFFILLLTEFSVEG